jgi:hypothetical protein
LDSEQIDWNKQGIVDKVSDNKDFVLSEFEDNAGLDNNKRTAVWEFNVLDLYSSEGQH